MAKVLVQLQENPGPSDFALVLKDSGSSRSFTSLEQQRLNNTSTLVRSEYLLLNVLYLICQDPGEQKHHVKIA